jgi:hypothetical protein
MRGPGVESLTEYWKSRYLKLAKLVLKYDKKFHSSANWDDKEEARAWEEIFKLAIPVRGD